MVCGEEKMKKLTWKLWLLIIVLAFSLLAIFSMPPKFLEKGVLITSVQPDSDAFEQGLRQGQIITFADGKEIKDLDDFSESLAGRFDSGEKIKLILQTNEAEIILYSNHVPNITIANIPKTNIKTGLDIAGGSRALVQAEDKELSSSEINDLVDVTQNRLNEFGISDIKVLPVSDLSGNNFMLVEVAGATPTDLQEMLSQQGKFEAKIGNETVFIGGERDISSVCRNDATCSYIERPQQSSDGKYYASFRFSVFLSQSAAERHAEITKDIEVNSTPQGNYLAQKLDFYLDDLFLEDQSLLISESLKGRVTTQISIEGSGSGTTQEEAYNDAKASMHKLQTILITGSLPYKLEIVKLDTISPVLGGEFIRSIFLAGIVALLAVSIVIFIRYKKIKSSLALLITSISEIIIILGIASFIEWNLDLPSIAGILATIGTGIDQQIIILDEARQRISLSIKQKLKRAFTIILGAYFTAVVALLPLLWAGAGLLKGFAITTLIGITTGVLITRPAFSDMIKRIEE